MKNVRYQKLRKTMLFLWFMVMPITFNLMSPVLIIMAGFEQTINMSFIVFSLWFLSSFFFGRAYCSTICQWGAMQEIFANMVPKKLHKTRKYKLRYIKYPIFIIWIVFIVLGTLISGGYIKLNLLYPNAMNAPGSWSSFDPLVVPQLIFYFGIQLLIVLPFTLLSGGRSFCNYYCPMAVIGVIGTKFKNKLKYPSLHLEVKSENCIQCGKCSKNCPMSLDVKQMVNEADMSNVDCILCGECISNCSKEVILYAWKWSK